MGLELYILPLGFVVVLMGTLFAMAPALHTNPEASIALLAAQTLSLLVPLVVRPLLDRSILTTRPSP